MVKILSGGTEVRGGVVGAGLPGMGRLMEEARGGSPTLALEKKAVSLSSSPSLAFHPAGCSRLWISWRSWWPEDRCVPWRGRFSMILKE